MVVHVHCAVPLMIYVAVFYVHVTVLSKSGTGDRQLPPVMEETSQS